MAFSAFVISYYSELSFMITAINKMYKIKSKDVNLDFQDDKLSISFFNKVKLITGLNPNKKMERMIKKGYERLYSELDLMDVILEHKSHRRHFQDLRKETT